MRNLIVSFPKSGTHLLGSILSNALCCNDALFVHYDSMHNEYSVAFELNQFGGNRERWVNLQRELPFAFYTAHKFTDPQLLLYLIRTNEVAMSHLPRRFIPIELDACFNYILLIRKIEDIVASTINAEIRIVEKYPGVRDSNYLDIDFDNLNNDSLSFFSLKVFNLLVPHLLDMYYWRFSNKVRVISYDDLFECSSVLIDLVSYVVGSPVSESKVIELVNKAKMITLQTKLEDDDRSITSDFVLDVLKDNELFVNMTRYVDEIKVI